MVGDNTNNGESNTNKCNMPHRGYPFVEKKTRKILPRQVATQFTKGSHLTGQEIIRICFSTKVLPVPGKGIFEKKKM
ncbi:MAG TPA: hypothetical protein DCO83_00735 [Mucilaginibacter sp.]|nr:hypothetical protein [Mucilaginibacter sp.]